MGRRARDWPGSASPTTAPGIDEADIPSIFQIFASTKGSSGTGLGLPVSQKIIREHGGKISVTSLPGTGATFLIELPMTRRVDPRASRRYDHRRVIHSAFTAESRSSLDATRRFSFLSIISLLQLVVNALHGADDQHAVADAVGQVQLLQDQPERRFERNALQIDAHGRVKVGLRVLEALGIEVNRYAG